MTHAHDFLQAQQPDVLLMQELKTLEFPAMDFKALGYESVAIGQKSYNGVAILSKLPIETVTTKLDGDDEDTHARFIEAILDEPDGKRLRVVCIYLPNGNPIGTEKFI